MTNRKVRQPESRGAPEWVVSYGDMMSLLLCFFIMIVSMSEIRDDDRAKFHKVLQSLKETFGYVGGAGALPSEQAPENSLLIRLQQIDPETFTLDKGDATDKGVDGRRNTVQQIREGIKFTIGGQIGFAAGSAELRDEARAALQGIVEYTRGENNKIDVRGHSTPGEAGPGTAFPDEHKLAHARAAAVADCLIEMGIRPERIRRVDCGSTEPLILRAYDEPAKMANRRVEIIVMEVLVQEYETGERPPPPPPVSDEPVPTGTTNVSGNDGRTMNPVVMMEGQ